MRTALRLLSFVAATTLLWTTIPTKSSWMGRPTAPLEVAVNTTIVEEERGGSTDDTTRKHSHTWSRLSVCRHLGLKHMLYIGRARYARCLGLGCVFLW